MADTFEEIYRATALGATELDDGEHTILTTNSTTRYVIKDMYVNGTSGLTNTYLELNGFNVGSISSNATGSLIIPPSSTLKIKTTDYPYKFYRHVEYASENGAIAYTENYLGADETTSYGTPVSEYSSNYLNQDETTDALYGVVSNKKYIWTSTSDNNSVQKLNYLNLTDNQNGQMDYNNYRPIGFHDGKAWRLNGSTLQYHDFSSSPTTVNWNTASLGGLKSNSYSPSPTASYPRGRCALGFYWYIPSNGYQDIYGINLSNGCHHKLTGMSSHTATSNSATFQISLDEENDRIYIYVHGSAAQYVTRAYLDGWDAKTQINSASLQSHTVSGAVQTTLLTNQNTSTNMASGTYGYDRAGGYFYKNTSYHRQHINNSGALLASVTQLSAGGNTITTPTYSFTKKIDLLTASEQTSLGITAPTFGIQLLGVKSV